VLLIAKRNDRSTERILSFNKTFALIRDSRLREWILAFGNASVLMHPAFKLHNPSFFSDIVVVTYILSCAA